jgi:single-strand DNA-binding protein
MLNRIVLIGRLCTDPELKYTASGIAVATFRIAVDRRPNAQGEKETDFISIVAWRQSAEFASSYLTKGRLISVDGRLQTRSWVAQDGTRRYSFEVVADDLRGLDKPKERAEAGPGAEEEAPPVEGAEPAEVGAAQELEDPFAEE